MKEYTSKEEYKRDVKLLKKTILNFETLSISIDELFNQWKNTSPDSPWYNGLVDLEQNAVDTLIKVSEEELGSEWCGEHIIFKDLK
tara:strand:- start:661 stop:918 length:258 start_codon:yes stop_codon:yes gene_type:complete